MTNWLKVIFGIYPHYEYYPDGWVYCIAKDKFGKVTFGKAYIGEHFHELSWIDTIKITMAILAVVGCMGMSIVALGYTILNAIMGF